jgi:hypothetical protein
MAAEPAPGLTAHGTSKMVALGRSENKRLTKYPPDLFRFRAQSDDLTGFIWRCRPVQACVSISDR